MIPNADFPKAECIARKRFALIDDVDRLVRFQPARVPEVAAIRLNGRLAAGDQHLIGRLKQAPPGGIARLDLPTEARLEHVDAQRIDQIFTAKFGNKYRFLGGERQTRRARHN